jgi:hypothetical protein
MCFAFEGALSPAQFKIKLFVTGLSDTNTCCQKPAMKFDPSWWQRRLASASDAGLPRSDGGTHYVVPDLVQFVPCHAGRSSDCDLIAA